MATCNKASTLRHVELPAEFEDLTGLIETDLRAIVSVLTERAGERLLLTRRGSRQLRDELWNRIVDAINETVAPLTAERR